MVEGDEHQEPVDEVGRESRRWPWIAATVVGLIVGFAAWNVMSFAFWFSSGGTLGGFGGASDQDVDWGRLEILHARWTWAPVVTAGVVPIAWAWRSLKRTHRNARKRARRRLAGILVVVLLTATSPPLIVLVGRSNARRVDDGVTRALERVTDGELERSIEKPGEDDPWVETLRSRRPISPEAVAANTSEKSGTWWCFERAASLWFFEPAGSGAWVSVDGQAAHVIVSPQLVRLDPKLHRLEPCR